MKFSSNLFKWLLFLIGCHVSNCQSPNYDKVENVLENYIRSIPKEERVVFQNYRRIWIYLANTFANGDLPTHHDFDSLFQYNKNEEKFLLRTMLTKDSVWNPFAFHCLDTLIKLQYQQKNYQSCGIKIDFHYSETDSGERNISRYKGIIHFSNTSKYVQKDFFAKYVHGIYPIPLMLDFTMQKKAKSYFCVNYDEAQILDSVYNEFAFHILCHIRWFSGPLIDSTKLKQFISFEEKSIFLQEYYRIIKLQHMCEMPEEDWQHRSVRPVIDAFIIMLAKQNIDKPEIWKLTGLSTEIIHLGLVTLANQWLNISPWLHHYITNSLYQIFHYYHPNSKIVLKLPSGKESIRRKSNAEPILIAPIKVIYQHPNQPTKEVWYSIPIVRNSYPKPKIIKMKIY